LSIIEKKIMLHLDTLAIASIAHQFSHHSCSTPALLSSPNPKTPPLTRPNHPMLIVITQKEKIKSVILHSPNSWSIAQFFAKPFNPLFTLFFNSRLPRIFLEALTMATFYVPINKKKL
jgi:hypothetical protein